MITAELRQEVRKALRTGGGQRSLRTAALPDADLDRWIEAMQRYGRALLPIEDTECRRGPIRSES